MNVLFVVRFHKELVPFSNAKAKQKSIENCQFKNAIRNKKSSIQYPIRMQNAFFLNFAAIKLRKL